MLRRYSDYSGLYDDDYDNFVERKGKEESKSKKIEKDAGSNSEKLSPNSEANNQPQRR